MNVRSVALTAAALAFVLVASACVTTDTAESGSAANQCYWLSNATGKWEPMEGVDTRALCAELDSCSGGGGMSGGGCYKWASSPHAAQTPW